MRIQTILVRLRATAGALALWALALPALGDDPEKGGLPSALVATLQPTDGSTAAGTVVFTQTSHSTVTMAARIQGLMPNRLHAIHIHQFGDLTLVDGSSAGSHYNPEGRPHGLPQAEERHAGDLGNLLADASGQVVIVREFEDLTLAGKVNPIVGRSVVIHAGRDLGTQPAGDAGPRIAFGVIGYANPDLLTSRLTSHETRVYVRTDDSDFFEKAGERLKIAANHTGRALKKAAQKTEQGLEKAAEKTGSAVARGLEEVGEALEKTGRAIQRQFD